MPLASWIVIGIAAFVLLAALFPFLLTFPIACWETRYVWPYEPLTNLPPGNPVPPTLAPANLANPYAAPTTIPRETLPAMSFEAQSWNQAAQVLGMRYIGVLQHATSKLIKIRYDFWLSPGREFLAIVGSGKVASVPVTSIFLWSVLGDGRIFTTINADSAADPDLTSMTEEKLFPGEGFELLGQRHWARLMASGAEPQRFSADNPLRDLAGIRRMKYDRLEELGYCRFLDGERNAYRLTVRGAFWYALISVSVAYRRQFSPDKPAVMPR